MSLSIATVTAQPLSTSLCLDVRKLSPHSSVTVIRKCGPERFSFKFKLPASDNFHSRGSSPNLDPTWSSFLNDSGPDSDFTVQILKFGRNDSSVESMGAFQDKPADVESKHFPEFKKELPRLEGKVVAVTGCTSGTGFVAAKTCAELGAHVIMLNRASERATAAFEKVKAVAASGAKVVSIECDLADFESVRKAAKEVQAQFPEGLDVLANNAGVMAVPDEATKDGYDVQMQTNHLSHFLLTRELLPLLEKAAEKHGEARIVNHSSTARKNQGKPLSAEHLGKNGGKLGGNEFGMFTEGPRWVRYQNSKLANMHFTFGLHDRLTAKGSKVKCLAAAPGFADTNLFPTTLASGENRPGPIIWLLSPLFGLMRHSAEDGTIPILTCMLSPTAEAGEFYEPANFGGMNGPAKRNDSLEPVCLDPESKALLWTASEAAVGPFVV